MAQQRKGFEKKFVPRRINAEVEKEKERPRHAAALAAKASGNSEAYDQEQQHKQQLLQQQLAADASRGGGLENDWVPPALEISAPGQYPPLMKVER